MAEKNRYPQIPSTVWWGLRSILQKTPNATIDERLLGVQLGVQEAAARQYVAELKAVNILTEDSKATTLAQKWRLDDSYPDAVQELIKTVYPEGLITVAPPGEGDRPKIVNWFLREGLGQGAAGNKAATYLLLGSPTPNEAPTRNGSRSAGEDSGKRAAGGKKVSTSKPVTASQTTTSRQPATELEGKGDVNQQLHSGIMPLNINVQIHISADAGTDQIETIFKAMRRYLNDGSHN